MYVCRFTTIDDAILAINMMTIEALLQKGTGTVIVTSNDTYHVKDSFEEVDKHWLEAAKFEAGTSEPEEEKVVETITFHDWPLPTYPW